jgi:hypothetical protein
MRFEEVDDVSSSRSSTLLDLKVALEATGIEFTGSLVKNPGITIRTAEP